MTDIKQEKHQGSSSDLIHNKNCFDYLSQLKIPRLIYSSLPASLTQALRQLPHGYNETTAYGDLYEQFISYVEANIYTLYDQPRETLKNCNEINMLDDFILSLYENDNNILEQTFATIKEVVFAKTPTSSPLKKEIAHHVRDQGYRVNKNSVSPSQNGSCFKQIHTFFSSNFKPQHVTGLPTIRRYRYQDQNSVREYRINTQGQRHEGIPRVSPLFKRFLNVIKTPDQDQINHIYFNNLGRDYTDFKREPERDLTVELEDLEREHSNIAVITLPADKGLLDKKDLKSTQPQHDPEQMKQEMLLIAQGQSDKKIKDFYISDRVRKKLFTNEEGIYSLSKEEEVFSSLISKSMRALGYDSQNRLSSVQRQIIWFHFIKFELTHYIIETLRPKSINFSCKDGIDRGGVASAYYNLLKSFAKESIKPMSREEFECALHAAATLVKGRGMNRHLRLIWTAVDAYVMQHDTILYTDELKKWLIQWRDNNCPQDSAKRVLARRMILLKNELECISSQTNHRQMELIEHGLAVLHEIKKHHLNLGSYANALLLEVALETTDIARSFNDLSLKKVDRYSHLVQKMAITYPILQTLYGRLQKLLSLVLFFLDIGKNLQNSGEKIIAEVASRQQIQNKMKEQLGLMNEELSTQALYFVG